MRRNRNIRAWLLAAVLLVLGGLAVGILACGITPDPYPYPPPTKTPAPPTPVAGPLPDLVAYIKGPSKARPGDDLKESVTVEVTNKGDDTAEEFVVGVYFSTDQFVDQRDPLLIGGRQQIGPLEPGETILVSLNGSNGLPYDVEAGEHYLGVIADEANTVRELDETNNTAHWPIIIVP